MNALYNLTAPALWRFVFLSSPHIGSLSYIKAAIMECWSNSCRKQRLRALEIVEEIRSLQHLHMGPANLDGLAKTMISRVLPQGGAPHICVVGAGIAGLRCAEILSKRGMQVTILEGRDRIGGRVHQRNELGHTFDLGPNWIHGTYQNPILDIATEVNATTLSPSEDVARSVYDESGNLMDQKTAVKLSELTWSIIADAFSYCNDHKDTIPPEKSLMDFFKNEVKAKGLDDQTSKLVLQMAQIWGDFVGEPIEKQSLKFFWLEECIEGENLFLASTYKDVLGRIAEAALSHVDLQLNTKVTAIASKRQSDQNTPVSVTTASGARLTFDEVIVTCPLGWLKRNTTSFTPNLPSKILKAINHISYGRLEKVYFTFPTAFWLAQTPKDTSLFSQFLQPTYTEQNPARWGIECVSLASLPSPCAHPTLLFYINGPCAKHVTSLVKDLDPASHQYSNRLTSFFAPYYSRLPNYSASAPHCQPVGIVATNWQNDEFAGYGSYTTFQTSNASEEVELDTDIEALREGCPEQGVWFAGEHTAPFVALGTVTGAYWSGQAVAARVADAYGIGGLDGMEELKN